MIATIAGLKGTFDRRIAIKTVINFVHLCQTKPTFRSVSVSNVIHVQIEPKTTEPKNAKTTEEFVAMMHGCYVPLCRFHQF